MAKPLIAADKIYDAALDILDHDGLEALTARNLAAKLKCSMATLYRQVGKREQLIEHLLNDYFNSFHIEIEESEDWPKQVMAWCLAVRRALKSHPNLSRLLKPHHRDIYTRFVTVLYEYLLKAGIGEVTAIKCCKFLGFQVSSMVITEINAPTPAERREKIGKKRPVAKVHTRKSQVGKDQDYLSEAYWDELFINSLGYTISGIERELKNNKARKRR